MLQPKLDILQLEGVKNTLKFVNQEFFELYEIIIYLKKGGVIIKWLKN